MSVRILVFCKAPVAGAVKTRLTPEFSAEEAMRIHEQLASETLQDCLAVQKKLPDAQLELWCSPNTEHPFFSESERLGFKLMTQSGDDLGERMFRGFSVQSGPAILIGTDCPPIDGHYLLKAAAQLETCDAVLGLAEDGGYGLIGLKQSCHALFTDILWSTNTVLDETLKRCDAEQLQTELLPMIWDVDDPPDVTRWQETLRLKTAF
jgi:rSAM/selenodomain-associated transferase 1